MSVLLHFHASVSGMSAFAESPLHSSEQSGIPEDAQLPRPGQGLSVSSPLTPGGQAVLAATARFHLDKKKIRPEIRRHPCGHRPQHPGELTGHIHQHVTPVCKTSTAVMHIRLQLNLLAVCLLNRPLPTGCAELEVPSNSKPNRASRHTRLGIGLVSCEKTYST